MESEEYLFDIDDQRIFAAKNSDLKAKVLRYHLMPRLKQLLDSAINLAHKIFDVDILEFSTISQSPGFRTDRRKGEVTMDYSWCKIGLTGVRKPIWTSLKNRKGGKSPVVSWINWDLELMEEGLVATVSIPGEGRYSKESYIELMAPLKEQAVPLSAMLNHSNLQLYANTANPNQLVSLKDRISDALEFDEPEIFFASRFSSFPIQDHSAREIANSLAEAFVIYDAWIRAAQGMESRVPHLLSKLNDYYNQIRSNNVEDEEEDEPEGASDGDLMALPLDEIPIQLSNRYRVFQRDGWKCVSCGRNPQEHEVVLHVDHILPRSKGGQDTLDNYQTLCNLCNLGKGNRDHTDLRSLHHSQDN